MCLQNSLRTSLHLTSFICLLCCNVSLTLAANEPPRDRPKLTVLFFVDQARFDQPLDGQYPEFQGFKRHPGGVYEKFFQQGVVFDYSEYQHAANYTAQGWGTIITGANPRYNGLPHSKHYEYNKQGQIAKFDPMDGIKTGDAVDPVPNNASGGSPFDFKVGAGEKVKLIHVRESSDHVSLRFTYQDAKGVTQSSSTFGTRWGDPGTGWTDIPMDIVGKVVYHSAGQFLDKLELFDDAGNLIHSVGNSAGNQVATEHLIKGDIVGATGRSGWYLDKLAFTTGNQWPGGWAQPGGIKTISDSFATQFSGSKVFAVGDWSYPVAMFGGKQGKRFWLGDALNGWNERGVFDSSTYIYPDADNDGEPDLPVWMSSYNTQNGEPPAKRTLDALTDLAGNPWNIAKCDAASHDSAPCWTWDTLYTRNASNYINYPYDDDNRGDDQKYELSKNTCAVWKRMGQDLTFPYEVGTQPAGVTCPVTVNGGSASGWKLNAYQNMLYGPHVANVITDAAKHIITSQQLGLDNTPDLLIVYIGPLDMVGHEFGIDSIEYEDTFYRVDKALGELVDWIDTTVGRDNVFYALTGDHGMDSTPEYEATNPPHLQKFHNEASFTTGRLMMSSIEQAINQSMIATLKQMTGKTDLSHDDYVVKIVAPTTYLDLSKIRVEICDGDDLDADVHRQTPGATATNKTDFEVRFCGASDISMGTGTDLIDTLYMKHIIDQTVNGFNGNLPAGTLAAYSYSTIQAGNQIPNPSTSTQPGRYDDQTNTLASLIDNTYKHGRSGQIYVVPKPHYYYYHSEDYAAMHSTPYWYDRYVQLMYLGGPTQYLPDDLRRVRNLAYAQGLGDNAYHVQQAGLKTQQHNITATIGQIMGIDYNNMPQAYRDRVTGESSYHSAYRVLTHLYRDDDYMRIRMHGGYTCLTYAPGIGLSSDNCDNSDDTAWHYDFKNKQLKSKHDICLQTDPDHMSNDVTAASCDISKAGQHLELLANIVEGDSHGHFILHPEGSRKCVTDWRHSIKAYDCDPIYSSLSFEAHADSVENRAMTHGPIDLVFINRKDSKGIAPECLVVESGVPSGRNFAAACYAHGDVWHLDRGMLKHMKSRQCLDADQPIASAAHSYPLTMVNCADLASKDGEPGKRQAHIELEPMQNNAVFYAIKRIYANGMVSYLATESSSNHRWVWSDDSDNRMHVLMNRAR